MALLEFSQWVLPIQFNHYCQDVALSLAKHNFKPLKFHTRTLQSGTIFHLSWLGWISLKWHGDFLNNLPTKIQEIWPAIKHTSLTSSNLMAEVWSINRNFSLTWYCNWHDFTAPNESHALWKRMNHHTQYRIQNFISIFSRLH